MTEAPDGDHRTVALGGDGKPLDQPDYSDPAFPDEMDLVVNHEGRVPEPGTPVTISEEAMSGIVDQFIQFMGGRIMSRMNAGKSARHVRIGVTITTEEEPHA